MILTTATEDEAKKLDFSFTQFDYPYSSLPDEVKHLKAYIEADEIQKFAIQYSYNAYRYSKSISSNLNKLKEKWLKIKDDYLFYDKFIVNSSTVTFIEPLTLTQISAILDNYFSEVYRKALTKLMFGKESVSKSDKTNFIVGYADDKIEREHVRAEENE